MVIHTSGTFNCLTSNTCLLKTVRETQAVEVNSERENRFYGTRRMRHKHMLSIILSTFSIIILPCSSYVQKFPLLMPNVHPDRDELYLCTPAKIVPKRNFYIVGFEPNATMDRIHHMILFGCTEPGSDDPYWDCGEMSMTEPNELKKRPPCSSGTHVIYAWARDAKSLTLPEGVGFQVGQNTSIKYLVIQLHYSHKLPGDDLDSSGLTLLYTETPLNKLAGVLLLGTGGEIAPQTITHLEVDCSINEGKVIHPFAYRVHTHSLGRVVSGYTINRDEYGRDHWTLLGKRDPMTPQMFYPVFDRNPIGPEQRLAARCTMESSSRNSFTFVGPTNQHEMCNFYLMYYVENDLPLDRKYCMSEGPPYYYWKKNYKLNNIPDFEASALLDRPPLAVAHH
ncbi:peptidylglycine alpha-hydroxylating monooxygenase isoform X2 [Harmonia axyridis]|nr:peptidylglycine alpha-hydroxylating monooxygenase isoform X2 [Harmonia axyridis]